MQISEIPGAIQRKTFKRRHLTKAHLQDAIEGDERFETRLICKLQEWGWSYKIFLANGNHNTAEKNYTNKINSIFEQ